jgi:hypothetical protein
MAVVFWDRKGVLMVEFMQQGATIMPEVDYKTLKKLCKVIQNKRRGMLMSRVLLHDNVHPDAAGCTQALREHLNWKLFDHPPYSPDLASRHYHLFTYPKNWLRSQCFNSNEELMKGVKTWLSSQAADFSILVMTTLRSSLSMYVFLYIIVFFFSLLVLLTACLLLSK